MVISASPYPQTDESQAILLRELSKANLPNLRLQDDYKGVFESLWGQAVTEPATKRRFPTLKKATDDDVIPEIKIDKAASKQLDKCSSESPPLSARTRGEIGQDRDDRGND